MKPKMKLHSLITPTQHQEHRIETKHNEKTKKIKHHKTLLILGLVLSGTLQSCIISKGDGYISWHAEVKEQRADDFADLGFQQPDELNEN
jgi:hypothetical protein